MNPRPGEVWLADLGLAAKTLLRFVFRLQNRKPTSRTSRFDGSAGGEPVLHCSQEQLWRNRFLLTLKSGTAVSMWQGAVYPLTLS